jgi:hypothetical protein
MVQRYKETMEQWEIGKMPLPKASASLAQLV